ncbi:MAG: methionine--tRNA ligase [Candidatus Omnitrophica bacterium]|nr:methionine--tRNA ligase [Candidatus Omnitrophota bacterium]
MAKKFYITTPIYYVNASPHIGHSYTTIAADTLARHMRASLGDENVWFLTGTDEHGQKIKRAADDQSLSPQEFVDKVVVQFKDLWVKLGISNNDFIRTTEDRHIVFVQKALEILYNDGKGDIIYKDNYEGLYCTPCETFWTPMQAEGQLCPDCKRPVEKISEVNYFFRTSKYQQWLIDHIRKNPFFIRPEVRRNEVLSFLTLNPLNDLCISRPRERLNWGIPLPFSQDHVAYVWFDALINYISAVGAFDEKGNYRSAWWQDDSQVVHLVGKDILRHHAVYWPIMLHALGIRPPDTIFAHGWWLMGENKMSKSRGNVASPLEMADKYGVDTYRYFLLRDVPFGLDGNFSEDAIIRRFNADLANDLGNLVFRTLTMIEKYYGGVVPEQGTLDEKGRYIASEAKDLHEHVAAILGVADFDFGSALEKIWEVINLANKYVEETKPWNLAKENKVKELEAFIRLLVEVIRQVDICLYPFMPRTAESIRGQIGEKMISKGNPLFPRINL